MNSTTVSYVIVSFGIGAMFHLVLGTDSESITILTAAAIAGFLSYISNIGSEETKESERLEKQLDNIEKSMWDFLKPVESFCLSTFEYREILKDLEQHSSKMVFFEKTLKESKNVDNARNILVELKSIQDMLDEKMKRSEVSFSKKEMECIRCGDKVKASLRRFAHLYGENVKGVEELEVLIEKAMLKINQYGVVIRSKRGGGDVSEVGALIYQIRDSNKEMQELVIMKGVTSSVYKLKKERIYLFIFLSAMACLGHLIADSVV